MSENTNNTAIVTENHALPVIPTNTGDVSLGTDLWSNLQTFELALRMANALAKSTIVPKEYQSNPSNCLIALEMASRMNTSPMQVMQNLFVINGRPSWSAQYIIGVINASRKYMHELKFEVSGKGESLACYVWTTDLQGEKIVGPTISMQMAHDEGWVAKNGSKWKTMPEIMIRYRAASFFGRLYCSDMIMGIYEKEEVIELTADEYSVGSAQEVADNAIAMNANTEVIDANEVTPDDNAAAVPDASDEGTGDDPEQSTQEQPPVPDPDGQMSMPGTQPPARPF